MEDGGWRMEDGGWRMEDGGWRMEDGGWRMEDGGWRWAWGGLSIADRFFNSEIRNPQFEIEREVYVPVAPDVAFATIPVIGRRLRAGEFTSVELTEFFLDRLQTIGPQ